MSISQETSVHWLISPKKKKMNSMVLWRQYVILQMLSYWAEVLLKSCVDSTRQHVKKMHIRRLCFSQKHSFLASSQYWTLFPSTYSHREKFSSFFQVHVPQSLTEPETDWSNLLFSQIGSPWVSHSLKDASSQGRQQNIPSTKMSSSWEDIKKVEKLILRKLKFPPCHYL